jgi:hypothetical protein
MPNILNNFIKGDWEAAVLLGCIFLGGALVMLITVMILLVFTR